MGKLKSILVSLSFFFLWSSCKKEMSGAKEDVFVKSIETGHDIVAVASFQLNDGNYLMAGFNPLLQKQGQLVKLDANGRLMWNKSLSPQIKVLWKAFPRPEGGFVTFGIEEYNSHYMYICLYDNDGNLFSTDSIYSSLINSDKTPENMMRLSNGNYVVAGGTTAFNSRSLFVRILSPSFTQLYARSYLTPTGRNIVLCRAICQLPDSTIAIAASVCENGSMRNLYLVRTRLDATLISAKFTNDTVYSESANVITAHNGSMYAITSRMIGYAPGNGITVDYFYAYPGSVVSGAIHLNRLDSAGSVIGRTQISDYPNSGMIHSMHPCNDGGYILCGTVNQLNTYVVESPTRIYLLKLDLNFMVQWSKIIHTAYPAIGVDALQASDGGYLVTGYQRSLDRRSEMLVIKTDAGGIF